MPTLAPPSAIAEDLLDVTAGLRRRARRLVQRPPALQQLTVAQLELVRMLRRNPGCSVADAADELSVAPNTVSTLVGQLCAAGIVQRHVDADDRRVARLHLVTGVQDTLRAWRDRRTEVVGAALNRLPDADQRRIAAALPALARLLDELPAGALS